jgi:choline dehydrogenase-like flavoprotein
VGGGTSLTSSRRGIKVVLLEAGARQSVATFTQVPGDAFVQLSWLDPRTQSGSWSVAREFPTLPSWTCKTVGGTTVHWTATTPRIREWELKARTNYGNIPGTSLIDWPIEFAELKNYYYLAERRMGVTRRNGIPGLPASNNFKVMYRRRSSAGACTRTIWRSIRAQATAAVLHPAGLPAGLHHDGQVEHALTEIPRAGRRGISDLRIQSMATRIEHGDDGRVNGVVYRDSQGREQRQKARIVCVAGNAIETARLLLLSESGKYPHGLANSSDQVGRNYMHHVSAFVWGIFKQPVHFWRGAVLAGVIEDETVNEPKRGFVSGYHLELASMDLPTIPLVGLPYGWGRDFASIMEDYRNFAGMLVLGEDMPQSGNRITLDAKVKDANGLPVAHVHVDDHPNDAALRKHAQDQVVKLYEALDAKRVIRGNTTPAAHNMGTARMSADPRDGVTNAWGQTHDIKNLFVSDGSVFSTSGSANPTLTIVALVLRQAEYISRQMSARAI